MTGKRKVIYLRVSNAESAKIAREARLADLPITTWIAGLLREHLGLPAEQPRVSGGYRSKGRSRIVYVRADPTLHRAVTRAARESGMTVSNWVLLSLNIIDGNEVYLPRPGG
jgi:predicted HicB family RNase H-like nuclease